MKQNKTLLETFFELQHLDRVPRMGFVLRGVPDSESVAEHSWHVSVLVLALAKNIADLNLERALSMALLHDVGEVRLGDLPATVNRYFRPGAKAEAESKVVGELTHPLGPEPQELLAELQERKTVEARLVKDCDKLQLMLKVAHYEKHGAKGLAEFWDHPENFPSDEFDSVAELFGQLQQWRTDAVAVS